MRAEDGKQEIYLEWPNNIYSVLLNAVVPSLHCQASQVFSNICNKCVQFVSINSGVLNVFRIIFSTSMPARD